MRNQAFECRFEKDVVIPLEDSKKTLRRIDIAIRQSKQVASGAWKINLTGRPNARLWRWINLILGDQRAHPLIEFGKR